MIPVPMQHALWTFPSRFTVLVVTDHVCLSSRNGRPLDIAYLHARRRKYSHKPIEDLLDQIYTVTIEASSPLVKPLMESPKALAR